MIDAGDKLADDRKWNEALEAYKAAIQIDAQNADAHIGLGDAYMGLGQSKEALDAYKKAVSIAPQNADALYALGDAYNTMRMHGDAFAPLVKATQLDPKFAEAFYGIGYAYLSGEQYEKSLSFLKRAISLKPDYDDAHYGLAIAHLHLGNQKGLDDERKKLVALNSTLAKKLDSEISKFNPSSYTTTVLSSVAPAPTPVNESIAPESGKQEPSSSPTTKVRERRSTSPPASPANFEVALWDSIKNSTDPADFEYYLRKYPDGGLRNWRDTRPAKLSHPLPLEALPHHRQKQKRHQNRSRCQIRKSPDSVQS